MHHIKEARRAERERTSMMSLGGDTMELAQNPTLFNQAAWLSARFKLGDAHARVLAEAHFGGLHSRAGQ